ncbi:EF-P lysine aminoacylase GenX [Desulfoluna limicola]|uniref:EF-P lysine aminoacylase GenX n=1 Tax=Desulfoluna limicola TaxID=2810562 RepID=A0ABM7PBG3_9BACT|nr:EF-P lysine aminoacylase EpmA [Desulfoluna limicola]BCS94449.1 EF-P lysine aminoacylase GenX [Desulfoluna limicola]
MKINLENLRRRAAITSSVRRFFMEKGYLEVETPLCVPEPIPEAHIDPLEAGNGYLQASPELCMKRLLAAGSGPIFQITKAFRKGERGAKHIPEMTLLEWYTPHADYESLMEDCRGLLLRIARDLGLGETLEVKGKTIHLDRPWKRLTVNEAYALYGSLPMEKALVEDRFDEVMGLEVEPRLSGDTPVLLCDYPSPMAALAKRKESDPSVAERFELYVEGLELANGFTELTDAVEQRQRFEEEVALRARLGKSTWPIPEKFLADLPQMPPTAGIALGMDRLVMLFCGTETIDDVLAFPPESL